MQKRLKTLGFVAALAALTGCSSLEFPGVYRISIQQGNFMDKEMLDQLELGMTRSQVRFIMGTPLIQDTFNPDRWDYFYSLRLGDGRIAKRHVTLKFDGEVLAKMEGDLDLSTPPMAPDEPLEETDGEGPVEPENPLENPVDPADPVEP